MKKILIIMLAIFIGVTAGCSNKNVDFYDETEKVIPATTVQTAKVDMTLESCCFTKEISVADKELSGAIIPEKDGNVYIDTVFYVNENDVVITEDDFTAELNRDSESYEFGFCYEAEDFSGIKAYAPYPVNTMGRIHLFFVLPEETALSEQEQRVKISAFGKEYEATAVYSDNIDPLASKTELVTGGSHTSSNGISFKVIGIETGKYISASAEGGTEYKGNSDFHELIIELTNSGDASVSDLYSYSFNDAGAIKGSIRREINNNTDLAALSESPIAIGESALVHVFYYIEDTDGIIRLNIGTECYYCRMK